MQCGGSSSPEKNKNNLEYYIKEGVEGHTVGLKNSWSEHP
jgi:hypothetical protein